MGLLICSEMEWHGMDGMIVLLALFFHAERSKNEASALLGEEKSEIREKKTRFGDFSRVTQGKGEVTRFPPVARSSDEQRTQ